MPSNRPHRPTATHQPQVPVCHLCIHREDMLRQPPAQVTRLIRLRPHINRRLRTSRPPLLEAICKTCWPSWCVLFSQSLYGLDLTVPPITIGSKSTRRRSASISCTCHPSIHDFLFLASRLFVSPFLITFLIASTLAMPKCFPPAPRTFAGQSMQDSIYPEQCSADQSSFSGPTTLT